MACLWHVYGMFNEVSWFQDKILMVSGRNHEALDLGSRRQGPTHWRFTTIETLRISPGNWLFGSKFGEFTTIETPTTIRNSPNSLPNWWFCCLPTRKVWDNQQPLKNSGQPWILICQWVKNLDTSKLAKFYIPSPSLQVHPELILFIASCTLKDVALVQSIYPLVI